MRKIIMFLSIVLFMLIRVQSIQAEVLKTNDRQVLSYEVLETTFKEDYLVIKAWAILPNQQHFLNEKTHDYQMILRDKQGTEYKFATEQLNYDLTDLMAYRGYPHCNMHQTKQKYCNYTFHNVGFETRIPLKSLKPDQEYKMAIRVHAKQIDQQYESPLYYPKDRTIEHKRGGLHYQIRSHYNKMGLTQFYHTLVARTKPEPFTTILRLGHDCSAAHRNEAFFKQGAIFNQILDVKKYKNLITYFKVAVKDAGCQNNRRRIEEDSHSNIYAYVPSTYVNYHGEAMNLSIETITSKPEIIAHNQVITQYETFNPLFDTIVSDPLDYAIQNKLKIKHNINNRIPGTYEVCYSVTNRFNNTAKSCINVQVIPIKTRIRYIHPISFDHLIKRSKLWKQQAFQKELLEALKA